MGDVSVDNGPVPGPEVRPDGRPPRVKANIQSNNNNKFNGQKDQRTRIPVSTEIPVEFELGTDVPVIPQDFLPPPAAPEETPFSSIPTGQDFKPQNNLFNQPAESFTTRRPTATSTTTMTTTTTSMTNTTMASAIKGATSATTTTTTTMMMGTVF